MGGGGRRAGPEGRPARAGPEAEGEGEGVGSGGGGKIWDPWPQLLREKESPPPPLSLGLVRFRRVTLRQARYVPERWEDREGEEGRLIVPGERGGP